MKKKRLLGILLSLALMLGLLPGMSLTAFANEHTHNFEYSASGDTITATCQNAGCNLTENKVTLTIKAPENLYYNDTTASHAATLENLDVFNTATGRTYSADKIVYYKGGSTTSISNPKMATYTAKIAINPNAGAGHSDLATAGKFASVTFTFIAKPVEHTHSFSYTANGAVITATCTSTTGTCDLTNKQATLTLNAPEHTLYGDGKNANATFTGEIPGVNNPTINYRKSDTPLNSAPTDAGTYTAWCQLGNATASVEYTIGKATNNGWTTLPQAINNLVYTGQPQDLITAGVPSAGNALYTVGTDPNKEPDENAGGRPYTSSVPEMTNAGKYYVWCKIDGGKNYTSINAQKVEVTIARADITPSVSIVGWTYGQTANTPMVGDTDNPGNGEVTYTYKVKDADDSTYKSTVPTAAGNYTVKAVIAETANYKIGEDTKDFTISKAALTVTAKDQNISVGDEVPDLSDPVLDTHYTVTGLVGEDKLTTAPTLAYQKNGNAATPDNTALGTYDIVASGASAGDNYTISYTNGTLTVEKGKAVAATVTANNRTYDGTEKPLVTVTGEATGGTMQYAIGTATEATGTYGTSIPTATNAGTYKVWYKVAGDAYHNDSDAASVTVTISPAPVYSGGGSGASTYAPTVSETENGTATVSPTSPKAGDKVTVTAKPDEGYEVDAVTVKDANGKAVEVTKNADGTYSFTQPAGKVTISATFKKIADPDANCPMKAFTDLDPNAWYHDGIHWALENGVMNGVGGGKFDPDGATTRAMIVTILYRLEGSPAVTAANPFDDVAAGQWYTDAVIWAAENKIVSGYGDGKFGPDDAITREQLAVILYRYAQTKGEGFKGLWSFKLDFPDAADVSDWATEAVSWMVMNGVINGKDGKLVPGGNATRAEAAAMLMRYLSA